MNLIQRIVLFCFIFFTAVASGQTQLEKNYAKIKVPANDTSKVNALNFLAKYHVNVDVDSSRFYVDKALTISEKLDYRKGIATAYVTMGILETELGNFPEALNLLLKASDEAEEIKDYQTIAGAKLNLGNFYIKTGDIDKALVTYREGIAVCEQHQIFYTQASLYTSVGMGLKLKGQYDSALYYYDKVLEIHYNTLHDSVVIAAIYNNIASLYFSKNDSKTAENYLLKSYEINKRMGNQRYQLMNLSNLAGMVGHPDGDYEKSMNYFNMAIEMGLEMKSKDALQSIYENMGLVSYNHSHFKEACEYIMISQKYKDSIMGEDQIAEMNAIAEDFKTKQFQDSLRIKEQELALSQSNADAANLRASKTNWQLLGAGVLLLCILAVLFFVYRHSKNQKRINALLHEKNEEINHQKLQIVEKNTELTDSINYAKRIQQALLPSSSYLVRVLGDHFLIFKPKDIVSGDFYWVKYQNNKHYFAVADCTGHGVPGAMMSMLGFETIERISATDVTDAAMFLNRVNESLINSLTARNEDNSNESRVKDGMDLSLCIVSDKRHLSYCGANNECYIIRKNSEAMPEVSEMIKITAGPVYSVIELKATKRPVGLFDSSNEFKSIELQLVKGDMFYLFSDGYADQFGGEKGKKMKTSTFRDTLLKTADLSMTEQGRFLEKHLLSWQQNFDQLDDITVLGIKVE